MEILLVLGLCILLSWGFASFEISLPTEAALPGSKVVTAR
jgi:uncharacterized protein (DUF486 family)